MAKPQSHEAFEAEQESRRLAVEAAGWRGNAAVMLSLRGDTPAAFAGHMADAATLRAIANLVRGQLTDCGVDVDLAVERSIIHALPLAECRSLILLRLAEHDAATHTDTSQPASKQETTGDVYSNRRAQMTGGASSGRR